MTTRTFHHVARVAVAAVAAVCGMSTALAQLNQNCTVSVLNRTVPVAPDGTWVLPNVPANFGQVKARATCVQNGATVFGESAFFTVPPNGAVNLPPITLGTATPIPSSLGIAPSSISLTTAGQTVQLVVNATYPDGSTNNVTAPSTGTNYTVSNPAIATISAGGLVTAVSNGTVVIQANNDGATAIVTASVVLGGATLCGGLVPVSWFTDNHLNPSDPLVCMEDPDRDGLTNQQEFLNGTDPNNPDTDGDGLNDGDEVNKYHSSPLLVDTDGDRIPDGIEVQTGTNPTDRNSYDLKKATATSTVTPPSITLRTSVANPVVSVQLNWKVTLIDGKTVLDLTADPRTNYTSSDLNVCSFGGQPLLVFSVGPGTCVVTLSQNTLSVPVPGTVSGFSPTEISTLNVPGAVAVDVAGTSAYIATGTGGVTVVDVTDRTQPRIRGTLGGIGNAQGVRASGQTAFIADSTGFVRIVNAENPAAPVLLSSLAIPGSPVAMALHGSTLAVAAQSGGVSLVNVANPSSPALIASFTLPAPALGVDFDPQSGFAAVAMGTSGLQIADVSTPASPKLRGLLAGGDVRGVLVRLPAVLLADAQRSVTSVDVSNPAAPVVSSSLPSNLGGIPVDIAAFGNLAMTADVSFGRAVPLVNISSPLNPSSVGFWTLLSPGFSSSIAVDISFGYLIIPATGTLRILKYQDIVDTGGIPPTVSITFPTPSTTLIQGQSITIAANATDDVAVASVTFLVNGQPACTTASQPYQCGYTVPQSATTLTFGATAIDFGNNTGTAANVVVPVIPDPLTAAAGRVIDAQNNPVAGATVSSLGISGTSAADGTFRLTGLPTIRGQIVVNALATVSGIIVSGVSAPATPVVGGTTNVGDIKVFPKPVITSLKQKAVLANMVVPSFVVTGANLTNATFSVLPVTSPPAITFTVNSVNPAGTSADLAGNVAQNVSGKYVVLATSPAGTSDQNQTPANTVTIYNLAPTADTDGDGLTNAQEVQLGSDPTNPDTDGDGFADGLEVLLGSDPLNPASVPTLPSLRETESLTFSVLNGAVSGGAVRETESLTFSVLNGAVGGTGIRETESLTFSVLNGAVAGGSSNETESVTFSVLNSTVTGAPVRETESVAFSVLNGAVAGTGVRETESLTFSVLNGAVAGTGVRETESLTFSVLNGAVSGTGTREAESLTYSVLNGAVSGAGLRETESRTFSVLNGAVSGAGVRETESKTFSVQNGTTTTTARPTSNATRPSAVPGPGAPAPGGTGSNRGTRPPSSGSGPVVNYLLDSDGDGLPDWMEAALGTDPFNPDTDGDGLSDGDEVLKYHTNPLKADTDGDGYSDGEEVKAGSDPLDPLSTPIHPHGSAGPRASINFNSGVLAAIPLGEIKLGEAYAKQNQTVPPQVVAREFVGNRRSWIARLFGLGTKVPGAKSTF